MRNDVGATIGRQLSLHIPMRAPNVRPYGGTVWNRSLRGVFVGGGVLDIPLGLRQIYKLKQLRITHYALRIKMRRHHGLRAGWFAANFTN